MTITRAALGGVIAASRRRAAAAGTALGYNVKGSGSASGGANGRVYVSKFTLASARTLTELHGWFISGGGVTPPVYRVVCYAADGSGGNPGTRLAYTAAVPLPTAAGDLEIAEAGFSVALAAADYWLGFHCVSTGSFSGGCYGEGTGGTHAGLTGGASNPPPNPFGTPDTSGTRKHSCWAIVT